MNISHEPIEHYHPHVSDAHHRTASAKGFEWAKLGRPLPGARTAVLSEKGWPTQKAQWLRITPGDGI